MGNLKRWRESSLPLSGTFQVAGLSVTLTAAAAARRCRPQDRFQLGRRRQLCRSALEAAGEIPIPPYLNRESQESDKTTYQTVYSKIKGSVAAPTAGLHFTERVLKELDAAG